VSQMPRGLRERVAGRERRERIDASPSTRGSQRSLVARRRALVTGMAATRVLIGWGVGHGGLGRDRVTRLPVAGFFRAKPAVGGRVAFGGCSPRGRPTTCSLVAPGRPVGLHPCACRAEFPLATGNTHAPCGRPPGAGPRLAARRWPQEALRRGNPQPVAQCGTRASDPVLTMETRASIGATRGYKRPQAAEF
jgi:hypothetical protein